MGGVVGAMVWVVGEVQPPELAGRATSVVGRGPVVPSNTFDVLAHSCSEHQHPLLTIPDHSKSLLQSPAMLPQ